MSEFLYFNVNAADLVKDIGYYPYDAKISLHYLSYLLKQIYKDIPRAKVWTPKEIEELDKKIAGKDKPAVPPKKEMTEAERGKELDRILKEHGIDAKDATAEQKDFYGQFIGKTPDEIAKAVTEIVKDAKDIDPRVANEMKLMGAVLEGGDPNAMNKMLDELNAEGLPYEMMATEHVVALADGLAIGDQRLKGAKLPPKQDICPKDPKDKATLTAMFAYEQIMSKINASDLLKEGHDMSTITKSLSSIQVACQDKATELGLDATMEGSAPIRSTMSVFEKVAETQEVKKDKAKGLLDAEIENIDARIDELKDTATPEELNELTEKKERLMEDRAAMDTDSMEGHEAGLAHIERLAKQNKDLKDRYREGSAERAERAKHKAFNDTVLGEIRAKEARGEELDAEDVELRDILEGENAEYRKSEPKAPTGYGVKKTKSAFADMPEKSKDEAEATPTPSSKDPAVAEEEIIPPFPEDPRTKNPEEMEAGM